MIKALLFCQHVSVVMDQNEYNELNVERKIRISLQPEYSSSPKLYGLPKIHKEGTPLRPIVPNINAPTYKLAKFLTKLISPPLGQREYFIKKIYRLCTQNKENKDR